MKKETSLMEGLGVRTGNVRRFVPLSVVFGVGLFMLVCFLVLAKKSDAARGDFYRVRGELDSYRKAIWRLESLDPKELERQLARMNARFPSSEQMGIILGEITELAKNDRVSITSITPSDKTEARADKHGVVSVLNRIPIEMGVHGAYERLAGFISHLGGLENGVMKVDRFRLEKESAQNADSLLLSLSASLYVRQTLEQEILKEPLAATSTVDRSAGKSRFAKLTRNPFTKTVVQTETSAPVVLEGIIYDPDKPLALVNGETKTVGDTVSGMKIVEIYPDSVLFEKDGEQTKMRLRWD